MNESIWEQQIDVENISTGEVAFWDVWFFNADSSNLKTLDLLDNFWKDHFN